MNMDQSTRTTSLARRIVRGSLAVAAAHVLFKAAGVGCEVFDSLVEIRWRKLVWNVPFNGLGVAGDRWSLLHSSKPFS